MIKKKLHLQYGKTLHEVAVKNNVEEQVLDSLKTMADLCGDRNFLETMNKISSLPAESVKKALLNAFEAEIDRLTLNLLIILTQKKHFRILPKIFEAYKKVYCKAKGIIEIKVLMARKFEKDVENRITETLQKQANVPLRVNFEEDPALIGGIQFYERGYITDYSIKNYLESLGKNMLYNF